MTMFTHIIALIIKEFLAILRDRKARITLIGPPIAQLIIFGYAATFDLKDVPYAVYDEDHSLASRELLARFEGARAFRRVAVIQREDAVRGLIDTQQALLVLHVPQQFQSRLVTAKSAPLQVIIDGRNSNTAMLALNYVNEIAAGFSSDMARRSGIAGPAAELVVRSWYNPNLESRWFIVPGIVGLLTMVVTLMVTALSIAREREAGTFDQLLVTPMNPFEILVGKTVPGLVIGLFEGSIIVLLTVFWFDVPLRGSVFALYVGLLLFSLSVIGVGLMISAISATQQQGLLGAFLFMVPAVTLSGFATPIANMPEIIQQLTLLNPFRYFLVVVRKVFLEGAGVELLTSQYMCMAAIGVVTLFAAAMMFRRRMY